MSMYDRVFYLRHIPIDDANPGGSNAQFVDFTDEEAWNVCEPHVEEWISNRFRDDPKEFLKNDTGLLVVEVLETLS
jgi:putative NIF3 family GTP cyclohydrolase 1 type 2